MQKAMEVIDGADVCGGGDGEQRSQVARPGVSVGLEIPVPADGVAGLHCQAESIVGKGALGFSATQVSDIDARADIPSECAVDVEQWRGVVHDTSVLAVVMAKPIFHHERFTTI